MGSTEVNPSRGARREVINSSRQTEERTPQFSYIESEQTSE